MRHKITQVWAALADRERWLIMMGAGIIGMFVLYVGIWSPLSTAVSRYADDVKKQRAFLGYLQKASHAISNFRGQGVQADMTVAHDQNMLVLAEKTVKQAQLSVFLKQVQQPSPNQVVLVFEKVPFDALIQWLQKLTTTGVKVVAFSAEKSEVAGAVDVQVTLSI